MEPWSHGPMVMAVEPSKRGAWGHGAGPCAMVGSHGAMGPVEPWDHGALKLTAWGREGHEARGHGVMGPWGHGAMSHKSAQSQLIEEKGMEWSHGTMGLWGPEGRRGQACAGALFWDHEAERGAMGP